MELCSAEEAHVVCLFPTLEAAQAFDDTVSPTLPPIPNRPEVFGEQLIMDGEDTIIGRLETLLVTASALSVDDIPALARQYGGTAFPAHIDRPSYSVTAALGDIPPVGFTAAEITASGDTGCPCASSIRSLAGCRCCRIPMPTISIRSRRQVLGWSCRTSGPRR